MKKLYFGLSLLVSLTANAQSVATQISVANFPLKRVEANQKQKEDIYKNIDLAIKQMSNSDVALPRMITINMLQQYSNAFYSGTGVVLVTPYQLNIDGKTKHPKFSRGVELHEFGHAIFEANYSSILKNQKTDQEVMNAYEKYKYIYARQAANFTAYQVAWEFAKGTPDQVSIATGLVQAKADLDAVMKSEARMITISTNIQKRFVALNEFFADVFAVTLTKDPDVIRDALYYSSHINSNKNDRSFSVRASKRPLSLEPHQFYSLSRQYIYKYYLSNPEVRSKGNAWIIRKTLDSISCSYDNEEPVVKYLVYQLKNVPMSQSEQEKYVLENYNNLLNRCIDREFTK